MLTLIFGQLNAQDLIVTNKGDSLNCKITLRMSGNIHFKFRNNGNTLNSTLPKAEVKTYKYGYYSQNVDDGSPKDLVLVQDGDSIRCKIVTIKYNNLYYTIDTNSSTTTNTIPLDQVKKYKFNYYRPFTEYQKWVFSINGGYSQRLAEISKNLPSNYGKHIEQLKKGYHCELDFSYYFSEHLGLGTKYSIYQSSNSQTIREPDYYFENYYNSYKDVYVKDEHTIPYIGFMFSTRFYGAKKRGTLLVNYSAGYLGYSDEGIYANKSFTIKGKTLGLALDLGYDYWILRNTALGIRISLTYGNIKEYTQKTNATKEKIKLKDEYEGLSRIDISAGLRFGGKK